MQIAKQVILDEDLEVNYLEYVFKKNEFIQLKVDSLNIFNKVFNKFSSVLYEYANQIISLYGPSSGSVFEDCVTILSTIEDVLEIEINHLVIEAYYDEDIKQLVNFYEQDLKDASLTIAIDYTNIDENSEFWTPINIIAYIERNRIPGITMSIDLDEIFTMLISQKLFESYVPYLSCLIGNKEFDNYVLYNDEYCMNKFEKMYIRK